MPSTYFKSTLMAAAVITLLLFVSHQPVYGQCTAAPGGMMTWWPGEGNADDIQGPTYENGFMNSGASFAPGKVGQAFNFDGVDDFAAMPANANWAFGTGDFTVEFWMYSTTNDDRRPLVNNRNGPGGIPNMWAIEIYNVANRVEFHSGTTILMTATTLLTNSSWNHVAVTRTGTTLRMYINGVQAGTGTSSDDFSQVNDLQIGRDLLPLPIGDLGKTFGGKIDELSIFNRSLSGAEISAIFNAGGTGICRTCAAPPENIIAWWPGNGNANDIVNGYNGTLVNGVTYAAGNVEQAFSLDGNDDYITIPHHVSQNPGAQITIEAWVKRASPRVGATILQKRSAANVGGFVFEPTGDDPDALQFVLMIGGTYYFVTTPTGVLTTGVWQHVAATYDGAVMKIYVDGVEKASVARSGSIDAVADPMVIGKNVVNPGMLWHGEIDEVALLNRALTQTEIQKIVNAGSAGHCNACTAPPSNLINWWPGDGNAFDIVGSRNGIPQGGTGYGQGVVRQAFSFDGLDDFVEISMPNIDTTAGAKNTVEFWMYWRGDDIGPSGDGRMPFGFAERYDLYLMQGSFGFNTGASDIWGVSSAGLANRWVHVAAVFTNGDARTSKLFIDGVEQTLSQRLGSTGAGSVTQNARISGWAVGVPQNYAFDGLIDEVEVFNRELTGSEVQTIYNARSGGHCSACSIPGANMVAWWRGEDNGLDSVGTNHATLLSGAAFGPAMVSRGFVLDGTNDYLRIPASASIDVGSSNGFSANAWIRSDNSTGEPLRPILEWSGEPGDTGGYGSHFYLSAAAGVLFANLIDTNGTYHVFESGPGVVIAGSFYHVALTYDKTTGDAKLYRNGEIVANSNLGIFTPMTAKNLYVGARVTDVYGGPAYRFAGTIDEVQVYARNLSQSEIQVIYNSGIFGTCSTTPLAIAGCAAIPSGITSWWRAQGNALDSRKSSHASLMNGTTFVNGMLGAAFAFDGLDDYVSVPAFNMGNNWSVEGWINPASCSDNNHCPMFIRSNGNQDGMWIGYLGAGHSWNNEFVFNIGNGTEWQVVLRPMIKYPFGSWYHVAATRSGDTYSFYVNGVLRDQKTVAGVSEVFQSREVKLGLWNYGTAAYLQGRIDEISVYKRSLSPSEVWSIYNATAEYGYGKCVGTKTAADMDGDMLSDLSIFRPSGASGAEWWWQKSTGGNGAVQFGLATDTITSADFTGDGKTDVAFWRPSTGQWYVLRSEDYSFYAFPFGSTGDIPVAADFDGDGKADATVFRPSTATWYISRSTGGTGIVGFGAAGDKPIAEDFDGDGKADVGVFRPNGTGGAEWWIARSSGGVFATQFGSATDKAVPADYTGDGKADIAFWNPANGYWFVLRSDDLSYYAFPFGGSGDLPVPADYDGDAKADAGVFRPSNSNWYLNRSTAGILIQQFGTTGDLPLPNAVVR